MSSSDALDAVMKETVATLTAVTDQLLVRAESLAATICELTQEIAKLRAVIAECQANVENLIDQGPAAEPALLCHFKQAVAELQNKLLEMREQEDQGRIVTHTALCPNCGGRCRGPCAQISKFDVEKLAAAWARNGGDDDDSVADTRSVMLCSAICPVCNGPSISNCRCVRESQQKNQ